MARLSRHDESVIRRAAGLESYGWRVKADVRGFERPPDIRVARHYIRPDIIAKKGKWTRIIEVETPDTWERDGEQIRLLRKYARSRSRTEFMARTAW